MTESKRTVADGAALGALVIVMIAVNVSLVAFTEVDTLPRWALTVAAGIAAAVVTYLLVSRRRRRP